MDIPFPVPYQRILVPVDMRHSDECADTLAAAAWFARQSGGELHCLTVAPPFGKHLADMPADRKPDFEDFLQTQAGKHDLPIKGHFCSHESFEHVLHETVQQLGIDLVVMSTHSPKLRDYLLGSHSSRTLLHNPCSVFVLRGGEG